MPENRPLLRMLLSSIRKPDMFLKWEKKKKGAITGEAEVISSITES